MAGMDSSFLTGGAGYRQAPPPPSANAVVVGTAAGGAHVGVIGLVLIAAAVLIALDQLGFRFAVTAGKR